MNRFERETAALLRALRERDENTSVHSDRTCALAIETGRVCGLSSRELSVLRWAAALHDVGKIGIPDRVLLKPGRFDDEEMAIMRTHPRRGHDIVAAVPDKDMSAIAVVVLHHHEAFDGGGYPDGLKGEAIPVLARILAVVDSYDAIATVRPYHAARSHDQVMKMLHDEQDRKFDPHVLAAFARTIESSQYRAVG